MKLEQPEPESEGALELQLQTPSAPTRPEDVHSGEKPQQEDQAVYTGIYGVVNEIEDQTRMSTSGTGPTRGRELFRERARTALDRIERVRRAREQEIERRTRRRWKRIIIKAFRIVQLLHLEAALNDYLRPFCLETDAYYVSEIESEIETDVEAKTEVEIEIEIEIVNNKSIVWNVIAKALCFLKEFITHFIRATISNREFWGLLYNYLKFATRREILVSSTTTLGTLGYIYEKLRYFGVTDYIYEQVFGA